MADVKINVQIITAAAQAAVKNLNTLVGVTTKGFANLTKGVESVSRAVLNLSKAGSNITNSLSKIAKNTGNLFGKFLGANLAADAIRKLSSATKELVAGSVDVIVGLEKASARFIAFTGSVSNANKFVRELSDLEDQTPFEFEQIANAAQSLLSFGRSVVQTKDDLVGLADVATASGANIEELATIFGKAASVGAVTSRELNGLQANGIPIVAELGKQLGVTGDVVKKLANEGKINFAQFEEAFKSLSKEGGFAFQATQRQAETLGGRIKTLGDAFEAFQITVGTQLAPVLKAIITTFTTMVGNFTSFVSSVNGAAQITNFLIGALKVLANTGLIVYNSFNGVVAILNGLFAAVTRLAGGILSLITGPMRLFLSTLVKVAGALGYSDSKIRALREGLDSITNFLPKVSDTFSKSFDETATSMAGASQAVDEFSDTLDTNLTKEQENAQAASDAEKQRTADLVNELEKRTTARTEAQQKELEDRIKFEEQKKALENEIALADLDAALALDGEKTANDELELLRKADLLAREQEQRQIANAQEVGDINALNLLKLKIQADQAKRENKINEEQSKLDKQRREQLLKDTASMFGALAALASTGGAKLFKITKAFNLAEAFTSGVLAVQKAAASAPFPANIPAVIAETARAAANVIRIKHTEPSFEDGGIVGGNSFSGDRIKANVNSGEMILNRQQQAQLFAQANGQGGSGQMTQISTTVMLDSEVVARAVSKHVADGLKLGEVF